jgi:hypothetical protein
VHPGASVDDKVFVFLGKSVTDKSDDPLVLHVACIGHVRPVCCQTSFLFLLKASVQHHLLLNDICGVRSHGDCGSAVLEALDAVVVRSNPVRHDGGISGTECWREGLEEEDVGVMSLVEVEIQTQGIRPDLLHSS